MGDAKKAERAMHRHLTNVAQALERSTTASARRARASEAMRRRGAPELARASCAPSARAASLAHWISGWTRRTKAPWAKPQSVPASTFSRPTFASRTSRWATSSGCSTTFVWWLTTPGISFFPRAASRPPRSPLVLVAGVRLLHRVVARVDLRTMSITSLSGGSYA